MDFEWDFSDLFFGIDMEGKALLREEFKDINRSDKEKQLIDRYLYLYKNSYIILGLLLSDQSYFDFYSEISSKTDIRLYDIDICLYDKDDNLKNSEVLEEFLLGDKDISDTKLNSYIEAVWSSSARMRNCKKKSFISEENIGFSEYDKAMKFILDFTYSFVLSQKPGATFVYEKQDGKYRPHNSIVHGSKRVYDVEIKEKLDVLNRYYDILSFKNSKEGKYEFPKGIDTELDPAEKTLVSYNSFIRAFCSDYRMRGSSWDNPHYLSLEQKKDIYFRFHDEIPFDYEVKCDSKKCSNSFGVLEDDIYFINDSFKSICPCCGEVSLVNLPDVKRIDKVRKRVINRCLNDDLLEDKIKLLSELTIIGGIELAKEKVKRKGKNHE